MKKSVTGSKAEFPVLVDLGAKQTAAYSLTGFAAYVVGKDGGIASGHAGTKTGRPAPDALLAGLKKLAVKREGS